MSKYSGNTDNKFLKLPDDTIGIYNAWDSYNTARLVGPLLKELKENHQYEHYCSHVEPLQDAVVGMQASGLLVDRSAKTIYRSKLREELKQVDSCIGLWHSQISNKSNSSFNPNSPTQVKVHLFGPRDSGGLGLLPSKKSASGAASTDQEALTGILRKLRKKDEHAIPFLHALFHRSRLQTILERYMEFDIDPDSRIRPGVKMAKAKTMRLAYFDPPLQQWVPEIRHIIVAKPGYVFVSCDYSQLEAKILAYMASDEPSIEAFENGKDVHTANGKELFNTTDLSKAQRDYAKSFLYRIIYGGAGSDKERTPCPCIQWGVCCEKSCCG